MSVLTWVKQKLGSEVEMQQPEKRRTVKERYSFENL